MQRVLVEGRSRKDADELMGRTECNRVVNFEGDPRLVGQMVDVRITALAGLLAARRGADRRIDLAPAAQAALASA